MRKIFTFICAALMSVGMWAEPITVTWNNDDISGSGNSFTKDGVTLTCGMNIDWDNKKFLDGGTFTTDLGNFTEIKISADALSIGGEGWSGRTWTGNAASVSYSGEIDGKVYGVTFVFTIEEPAPQPQGVVTLILANLPEENRPATIELAGTFDEGTAELEKLDTGWFIYNFIHASADATGKFRDKTNPNMVLCEFIPANGDEEGKWVQAIFKISDYGYWDEAGWKGTACMWTEIDVTGEQYAWMENAPEPEPAEKPIVVFEANGKKKEVEVESLPHTFACDFEEENGELDLIIQELYELPQGGYCDYFNEPVATGNAAVTAGVDEDDNHLITVSEVFEGTATVSGKYYKYIDLDEEEFTYTLTISVKDGSATAVENVQTNPVQATKFFRDGMLLIEKNGKIYNVMGAEVK